MNPAGKLTSVIAGMAAGADSIDDLDVIGSGGRPQLFAGVYACSTLGQSLREFTHGHDLQSASMLRAHPVSLIAAGGLLPGSRCGRSSTSNRCGARSTGRAKQGASFGHTKIAGGQLLFDLDSANNRSPFGGGRYSDLVGLFSPRQIPGFGFGMGDAGIRTGTPLEVRRLGKQIAGAHKAGARVVVIVAPDEWLMTGSTYATSAPANRPQFLGTRPAKQSVTFS